jgi:beta-1,4-N-acetylglucosaminyltransferase
MILVILGTSELQFDRLLRAFETVSRDEPLFIQRGGSRFEPAGAECVEYLEFAELVDLVRRARLVVTHAGVGSIMTALAQGKRPVVVPRLHRFGEAVDDHQVGLARRLGTTGLVTVVEDLEELGDAIGRGDGDSRVEIAPDQTLVDDLRSYLETVVGRRTPQSGRPERAS